MYIASSPQRNVWVIDIKKKKRPISLLWISVYKKKKKKKSPFWYSYSSTTCVVEASQTVSVYMPTCGCRCVSQTVFHQIGQDDCFERALTLTVSRQIPERTSICICSLTIALGERGYQ